jgi:ABC-2 type transport system ATP-binding protein
MIEAQGLTKTYGDKTAVDRVSFTVQAGRANTQRFHSQLS